MHIETKLCLLPYAQNYPIEEFTARPLHLFCAKDCSALSGKYHMLVSRIEEFVADQVSVQSRSVALEIAVQE